MSSIEPAVFNSPFFTWRDPYVYINITDTEDPSDPPEDNETSVSLLPGDPICDKGMRVWKETVGQLLVIDFLAATIDQPGYKKRKYYLAEFPENYVFYVRKTTKSGTSKKERIDRYLIGGGHTFRSPNEFAFHAAWLMAGAEPGRCSCVYCDKSSLGQKERSQRMLENRQQAQEIIRQAKATGSIITREPNAMNKRGFLKDTGSEEVKPKRASLQFHYGARNRSSSSSGSGNYVKLVHGYDDENMEE
ncbi:hypothetical protein M408DRAFT_333612 [Serendipita vermifera MAFF 305830]|uniref:Cryptic loci regulator 2 N-terminal domain-containing protein n=1 Tax=Serendipita vermifera MAFF 305830 TaxID=933852 RepID=A0A0C2WUW3_SERVB|nr:hypothetical protein M408DRAFT_333612 [Serendipita vermifera MAFF 305830]